jgi:hypothetical protein
VLLEFRADLRTVLLTFFRNDKSLGVAFDNIPYGTTYFPCISLFNNEETQTQVTLNPKAKIPASALAMDRPIKVVGGN